MKDQNLQAAMKISTALPSLAEDLDDVLSKVAGEKAVFLLAISTPGVVQYVGNASRADALDMLEELLGRWKAGHADIPAHENVDLVADGVEVPEAQLSSAQRSARDDAAFLRGIASDLEDVSRRRLYQIAGRIETGFYPARGQACAPAAPAAVQEPVAWEWFDQKGGHHLTADEPADYLLPLQVTPLFPPAAKVKR